MATKLGGYRPEPPEGFQQRQKDKNSPTVLTYQAQFSFEARVKDELSLTVGDILMVEPESRRNSTEPGWLYGTCNCQLGYFPTSYVVLLDEPLGDGSSEDEDDYLEVFPGTPESRSRTGSLAEEATEPDEDFYTNCSSGSVQLPSPQKNMRLKHIHELMDTEEIYLSDIETVLYHLINILIERKSSQEETRRVITRWEQLIMASKSFFRCLRSSEMAAREDRDGWMIGEALTQCLPDLTIYQKYCTWVKQVEALLTKEVSNKLLKDLTSASLGITSYIVKPIQRITKYPLIIEKIVENTPKDHIDYENLHNAFAKATEICHTMNKTIGDIQNTLDLRRIQDIVTFRNSAQKMQFMSGISNRRLIHTEALMEIKNGREQETVMFLFHDCILLVLPRNPLKTKHSSSIELLNPQQKINLITSRSAMFLEQLTIPDVEATDRAAFHLLHTLGAEVHSLSLKAVNGVRRDKWVQLIQEAIKEYRLSIAKRRPSPPTTPVQKTPPSTVERHVPRKTSRVMALPTQRAAPAPPLPSPPTTPKDEPEYIPHPPVDFGTGTLPRNMRIRLPGQGIMLDYVAAHEFRAFKDYQLSLSIGDVVKIDQLQALAESDWVQVMFRGTSGWVPRTYLQEKPEEPQQRSPQVTPKSPAETAPAFPMENELQRRFRQRKASLQAAEEEEEEDPFRLNRASEPMRELEDRVRPIPPRSSSCKQKRLFKGPNHQ